MTDDERVLEPAEECCVCGWMFSDGGEPFVEKELSGPRKGEVLTSCLICASTGQAGLMNYGPDHKTISVVGNKILAELRRSRTPAPAAEQDVSDELLEDLIGSSICRDSRCPSCLAVREKGREVQRARAAKREG